MKDNIEKSLKRFLKRKVSYSLSLLIAFMISGEILSAEDLTLKQLEGTRNQILTKIRAERIKIKRKIAVNEKKIRQYNREMYDLVNKADFYAKPMYPSTQIFFSWHLEESGKGKDRTSHEFAETIDAVKDYYGEISPVTMPDGSIVMMSAEERVRSGNGVVLDDKKFQESIDLGVNIKLATPNMPTISPSITAQATLPTVALNSIATPTVPTPPTASGSVPTVSIAPTTFDPKKIEVPTPPVAPVEPSIVLFEPANIEFNGTGFGQPGYVNMPQSNIIVENYSSYNTSGIDIQVNGSGTAWTGTMTGIYNSTTGTLTTGNTSANLNAFISHVNDYDVTVNGTYNFKVGDKTSGTYMFASVNPYETGRNTSADKTFDFKGTLNMESTLSDTSQAAIVGFEHQLLANGPGGYESFTNHPKHILKNSGIINMNSGYNMVGIMIDTEYNSSVSEFTKLPETRNDGVINIGNGAHHSIGIDYGYYLGYAPNTQVTVGEINVDGSENYGVRLKDYAAKTSDYYDKTSISGTSGKSITVKGSKNIGISIAQGRSSGDPTADLAGASGSDLIKGINVIVDGTNDVGLYRNPNNNGANSSAMVLNSTKIGNFGFGNNATNSTLFRTDKDEVQLDNSINLTLNTTGTGNSVMQAGGTGTVKNAGTITATANTFYGLTAGDFASSTGATAINERTIALTGDNNIGIAVASSNKGENTGDITITGKKGSTIYNKGNFDLKGGTLTSNGDDGSVLYNVGGTVNISNTVDLEGQGGSSAIFAKGGTITSTPGANLKIGINGGTTNKGVGVYGEGGATVNLQGAQIAVTDGNSGIASFGTGTNIDITNGKLDYTGSGYAVYSDGQGKVNLSNATVNLTGTTTGTPTAFDIDLGTSTQPITIDSSTRINVKTSGTVVFNLKDSSSTTGVNLSTTGLEGTILSKISGATSGVSLSTLLSGSTVTDYRIAAVTSGTLAVGDLDKSGTASDATGTAKGDGYFYYQKFLAQNVMATAQNSTISAEISASTAPFGGKVVGFEMNGSKDSASNTSSGFVMQNSHLIADNIDPSGNGAIGAFVNYGLLDIDSSSDVKIETGANANESGIGLYATNGTVVKNAGNITVNGDKCIGIYSTAYRVDSSGHVVTSEFGGKPGEGTLDISNIGTIDVSAGKGTIGIYAENNNTSGSNGDVKVSNTGTIKVGGALTSGTSSIGIYASKASISDIGTIEVGDNGIGVYAANGSDIVGGNGTIDLKNGSVGIVLNSGSTISGTGNLAFKSSVTGNKTAVVYENGVYTSNLNIDGTNLSEGTLMYLNNSDVTNAGNLLVGANGIGMYTATAGKTATNAGTITASQSNGIGMVALPDSSGATGTMNLVNTGTINSSNSSVGMYTTIAEVSNTGIINVGDTSIGMYVDNSGHNVTNNNVTLTGTNGTGVYLKGNVGLTSNNITSTTANNTGLVLDGTSISPINVGAISLGDESVGVLATNGTNTIMDGNVAVGNSSTTKSAVGVVVNGGSNVTVASTAQVTAGNTGIGIYADGSTLNVDDISKVAVGTEGTYLYSKNSTVTFSGNLVADNQIGIATEGGSVSTSGPSTIISKNGGIGMYVKGSIPTLTGVTFDVQTGTSAKHSIGVYYEGISGMTSAMMPTINQNGDYTIGAVLDNSTGTMGAINVPATGKDQVYIMAKNNSTLTTGTVSVAGDRNIGVFGENSDITTADVSVGNSSYTANKSDSSIGVYVNGGKYTGSGNLSVGDNSLGIYGENLTGGNGITFAGNTLTVGNNAVGVYGSGNGGSVNVTSTSGITVGDSNAIGVYAKGMDANVTGDINVGTDTSVGIAQEGNGNINYTGNMNIANKVNSGSIGIYKIDGAGTITTSGVWNVGNNGYGIYAKDTTGSGITVNNSADMTLGMSGIGIYSSGNNSVSNSGTITVGDTDLGPGGLHGNPANHINSVGMYLENGSRGENTGTINITKDHSVGVFGAGTGTTFSNFGTINVDGGATGIHVRDNAVAVNETSGVINLGTTLASCGTDSIGMVAYKGATIENKGYIKVGEGIGMYVASTATLNNTGTIDITNGTGIYGSGTVLNTGTIIGGGTHISTLPTVADVGAVKIDSSGNITINGSYVSVGGTLETQSHLTVNGAYVDVTTSVPVFRAPSVSGDVNILPNFASTGNGLTWEVKNFVDTAASTMTSGTLTPHISPLYISKLTNNGDLMIAKRPYSDITLGKQFDELYDGLDKLLEKSGGKGTDAEMLMGMNEHLAGIKDEEQFREEAGKMLGETRGDIYSTIQKRMQNVDKAFDTAFDELESSYNFTRDSDKYSIIYNKGDYKDATMGIEGYDYDTIGLLYMKEKDGNKLHTKHGYTLGFAGSKFKFDEGSKEEIYSLRAGAHNVTVLSPEHKVSLLTRGELAYNRHQTERKIHLDQTYTNKASYNTYGVSFDNKLIKNLYQDFENKLDIYAEMNTEYGKIGEFSEKSGGLKLKVKDNDYFSAKAGAGVKASRRIYLGKLWSTKLTADAKYTYELGENYDGNKTKLKDGDNGYIKLITPEKEKGRVIGKAGVTFEKANNMGVTFEVEGSKADSSEKPSVKYGVRFNYKFFND